MKFYQEFSVYYDYIFPFKQAKLNFLKKNLVTEDKVLDVATGTGTYAIALAKLGYQVSAVDLSFEMVEQAKQKAKTEEVEVDFRVGDMKVLDSLYQGTEFNLINCIGNSLVHLKEQDEIKEVLTKMYSLLDNEGRLTLQIVNYDRILGNNVNKLPTIYNEETGVKLVRNYKLQEQRVNFKTELITPQGEYSNSVLLYPLQSKELRGLLTKVGFNEVEFYGGFNFIEYRPQESFPLVVVAKK